VYLSLYYSLIFSLNHINISFIYQQPNENFSQTILSAGEIRLALMLGGQHTGSPLLTYLTV